MLLFILLLIVIFVLWPVIRVAYTIYRLRRQAREAFRQATGNADAYQQPRRNKAGWSRAAKSHKKVIDPTEGEYVDWEKITVTETSTTTESTETGSRTVTEQQVTDVEWEDIRN